MQGRTRSGHLDPFIILVNIFILAIPQVMMEPSNKVLDRLTQYSILLYKHLLQYRHSVIKVSFEVVKVIGSLYNK